MRMGFMWRGEIDRRNRGWVEGWGRASKGFWVLASRLKVIPVNGERGRGISFTIEIPMQFVLWQKIHLMLHLHPFSDHWKVYFEVVALQHWHLQQKLQWGCQCEFRSYNNKRNENKIKSFDEDEMTWQQELSWQKKTTWTTKINLLSGQ